MELKLRKISMACKKENSILLTNTFIIPYIKKVKEQNFIYLSHENDIKFHTLCKLIHQNQIIISHIKQQAKKKNK
jgi:hypothetical protein